MYTRYSYLVSGVSSELIGDDDVRCKIELNTLLLGNLLKLLGQLKLIILYKGVSDAVTASLIRIVYCIY